MAASSINGRNPVHPRLGGGLDGPGRGRMRHHQCVPVMPLHGSKARFTQELADHGLELPQQVYIARQVQDGNSDLSMLTPATRDMASYARSAGCVQVCPYPFVVLQVPAFSGRYYNGTVSGPTFWLRNCPKDIHVTHQWDNIHLCITRY